MADAAQSATAAGTITIGGELTVNRLGFGAMRITGRGVWGPPADRAEAVRVLRRAVELGVNFIDTADAYGPDVSENLIGEALAPYPDDLVIATKGGLVRDGPGQWRPNGRPEHLRATCEGSLTRLGLEAIPLYQLHRPDPAVPLEDSVGRLAELRDEGKIRHIGLSNVAVDQVERAQALVPVASVQNRYNPSDRASEPLVERAEADGFAFIPWAPIGGHQVGEGDGLTAVAERRGVSPVQAAIAWQLARSPQMLPIPGTSSVAHLEENVAAASIELSEEELATIG
jgi:aryl-alcohol dehydrogenase-like predicted oxidoreductase